MPDLFYTDPTTLQSYSVNPITGQMVPLGGMPNYGTRGYAGVRGMAGSPSGPAVSPQSQSLISSQPVGARSGLFTPVSGPVGSTITTPSVPSVNFTGPATYTDPTTLQSYGYIPSTGAVVANGPGYGNSGTVIPQTSQSGTPGSMGPVDRRVAAQSSPAGPVDRHDTAGNARLYRQMHGLATADDSAATDALNAESLAAAQAGRTYFNPQLAQQYGQPMGAGQYGPRTDVVNALQTPQQGQPIMLAQAQQQPIQLGAWGAPRYYNYPQPQQQQYAGNNLLAQGIY